MMTRRLLAALVLAWPLPAQAVEYGGWYARATLDTWHDDNLARYRVATPESFPRGNQDLGADLGLAVGNVFLLAPSLDLRLTVSGRGSRAALYPEWSGASAGLFADLGYRWDEQTDAYVAAGSSFTWGASPYHLAEAGLERRLWPGGSAHAAAGLGLNASERASLRYVAPGLSLGVQQRFETGTSLALSYGYMQRQYEAARLDPQHQIFVLAAQRLNRQWELRARYGYTLATSQTTGFRNGFLTLGLAYYM